MLLNAKLYMYNTIVLFPSMYRILNLAKETFVRKNLNSIFLSEYFTNELSFFFFNLFVIQWNLGTLNSYR